jgi:hypothetical protein
MVNRIVLPELLDELPPADAGARRSRRDLRRLNVLMGHARIMARALREHRPGAQSQRVVELGAGDGHFLLSVARRLDGAWAGTQAILVDRLRVAHGEVGGQFERAGWRARVEQAEAGEWLRRAERMKGQTVISNLFFHQFRAEPLAELLRLAAKSADLVVAVEPRRAWLPGLCGRLLWVIGCNGVTRHDARISIRAGFAGQELTALWPERAGWELTERPAGLFSHLFIARRKE